MQTLWVDPNEIEDVSSVNNRKENAHYIDSLAESIINNGYLAEYPIIAVKSEGLGVMTHKSLYHGVWTSPA